MRRSAAQEAGGSRKVEKSHSAQSERSHTREREWKDRIENDRMLGLSEERGTDEISQI